MNRARHAIAVVLVATALCADGSRIVGTAPSVNAEAAAVPHSASFAARLVNRLSASFSRSIGIAAVRIVYQSRQDNSPPVSIRALADIAQPLPQHCLFTPFQFRLPPPSL